MKNNRQKGITLVALVVSIVVLLILAGVSLNLVLGNNGIVNKSKEAKKKYEEAQINEQSDLNNASDWIEEATKKTETPTVSNKVKPGDYIAYTVPTQSYTIKATETGYSSDQTFNTNTYTGKWQVLYNNDNGVEIISSDVVVNTLHLKGKKGYNNFVNILNTASNYYTNLDYATRGRSVGSDPMSPGEVTTLYKDTEEGQKYTYIEEYAPDLKADDTSYLIDYEVMRNLNIHNLGKNYWLASREVNALGQVATFHGRTMQANGEILLNGLWRAEKWGSKIDYERICGIRPVILLKSDIIITGGKGTEESPYTIIYK